MRTNRIAVVAAATLAGAPAGALAAKPPHAGKPASPHAHDETTTHGKSPAANVQFVIRGSLGPYKPAVGTTDGTISVTVASSNHASKALKGTTLVLAVTSSTKIVSHHGKPIAEGDYGIVKFRVATSNATWTDLTASQVIDQGASEG